jgi:hypothetical protein
MVDAIRDAANMVQAAFNLYKEIARDVIGQCSGTDRWTFFKRETELGKAIDNLNKAISMQCH